MQNMRLLVSFDGALCVVELRAADVLFAMEEVRNRNPGRTAVLVRRL